MENSLIKLKQKSKLAIDSCDYLLLNDHEVTDATTNPSLILKVLKQSRYRQFVQEIKASNLTLPREQLIRLIIVNFGKEILKMDTWKGIDRSKSTSGVQREANR